MKLYLSGPMTGIEDYNFPAFNAAADALRELGYDVTNPADTGIVEGWTWSDYLRHDVRVLAECDGLALLDHYWTSTGARLEHKLALDLGMPCRLLRGWLDEAKAGPVQFESSAFVRNPYGLEGSFA